MQRIRQYLLEAQQVACYNTSAKTIVTVERGILWLTMNGEHLDHWLNAGDAIAIPARRQFWISAERGPVHFETAEAVIPTRLGKNRLGLAGMPDFLRRNGWRRLSPAA